MAKNYPEIYEVSFGDSASEVTTAKDAELVSSVIREMLALVHPEPDGDKVTAGHPWRLRLQEQDDGELTPHLVIDVGEGRPALVGDKSGFANRPYCASVATYDNHGDGCIGLCRVEQNTGRLTIDVAGDFGGNSACNIAHRIAGIYEDLCEAIFPEIVTVYGDYEEP